ncbi:hypothetical protein I3842_12G002700 [Carya illinoinensis]|uniref:Uncharacterized protein n=1 Tax=Carya illinoinensis TaxID=32201 RepID=A0A922DF26_CARIL|nr:hypothetical protein I3842_12G002700 [Carya illinoinensis]
MYKLRILSLKSTEKFSSLVSSILIRRSTSSRVLHHRRPLPLSSASLCIDFFPVRWEKSKQEQQLQHRSTSLPCCRRHSISLWGSAQFRVAFFVVMAVRRIGSFNTLLVRKWSLGWPDLPYFFCIFDDLGEFYSSD